MTEQEHLKELLEFASLPLETDERLKRLVGLASLICNTQYGFLNLIQGEQFDVRVGVGCAGEPFLREGSPSDWVVKRVTPLEVEDVAQDDRFSAHPLVVSGPKFRAYLGVPLVTSKGSTIGSLCVVDSSPRKFPEFCRPALTEISALMVTCLELKLEELRTESQLKRVRLASHLIGIGQLASELVHEMSNPLAVIYARASIMRGLVMEGKLTVQSMQTSVDEIFKSSERIHKILRGIRSFSVDGIVSNKENTPLSVILDETLYLRAGYYHTSSVSMEVSPIPESVSVWCNRVRISQVLLNLLNNACEAVSTCEERWVRLQFQDHGDRIELRVMDSGKGISKSVQAKLYEPFFTTKSKDQGTGLGLSISKEIMDEHQGSLRYEEVDGHTAFVLELPKGASV